MLIEISRYDVRPIAELSTSHHQIFNYPVFRAHGICTSASNLREPRGKIGCWPFWLLAAPLKARMSNVPSIPKSTSSPDRSTQVNGVTVQQSEHRSRLHCAPSRKPILYAMQRQSPQARPDFPLLSHTRYSSKIRGPTCIVILRPPPSSLATTVTVARTQSSACLCSPTSCCNHFSF